MRGLVCRPVLTCLAVMALAGAASGSRAADFVAIRLSVPVARPADAVWSRVGGYCAIAEWLKVSCDYGSGTGEVGTVRRLRDRTVEEAMVAQTAHSYTYLQTVGSMVPFAYHGTLAVEPAGKGASTLHYTLFYDQGAMASDTVRASEKARMTTRFQTALETMKSLAEAK
ncbi:SRPBCC family protein [Glacieibacterium sp.]|uniref:SRPBCC family protein n=1 Tax=Glacieibacterium sp. TaxID=2860237 RepID=UPI003AFFCE2F